MLGHWAGAPLSSLFCWSAVCLTRCHCSYVFFVLQVSCLPGPLPVLLFSLWPCGFCAIPTHICGTVRFEGLWPTLLGCSWKEQCNEGKSLKRRKHMRSSLLYKRKNLGKLLVLYGWSIGKEQTQAQLCQSDQFSPLMSAWDNLARQFHYS